MRESIVPDNIEFIAYVPINELDAIEDELPAVHRFYILALSDERIPHVAIGDDGVIHALYIAGAR